MMPLSSTTTLTLKPVSSLSGRGFSYKVSYLKALRAQPHNKVPLNYSIKFSTILPPKNVCDTRLLAYDSDLRPLTNSAGNRFLIKQSYIILTWAAYASNDGGGEILTRPLFAHLPSKRKCFTITKAPMAHKTFSQEQYQYRFYSLIISFKSNLASKTGTVPSINESLYLALTLRRSSVRFNLGTNLFFITRFSLRQPVLDKTYWVSGL